jgi:hypothetical protein
LFFGCLVVTWIPRCNRIVPRACDLGKKLPPGFFAAGAVIRFRGGTIMASGVGAQQGSLGDKA